MLILMPFYLELCIWPNVIDLIASGHYILCKFREKCDGDPGND
jgi:hypothetical protein